MIFYPDYWQFKSGAYAPLIGARGYLAVADQVVLGLVYRAWDRSLGAWVHYEAA